MMGRTGKALNIIMAAVFAWGLILVSGCDEGGSQAPPPPKPKVVSKRIAQQEKAGQKPGAPAGPARKPEDKKPALEKTVQGAGPSSPAVTEDLAKREKVQALNLQTKEEEPAAAATAGPLLFHSQEKYDFKGRVDPFIPLLNAKQEGEGSGKGEEAVVPKRMLTPLEKMELSQIKLVAIIQTSKGAIAMVEEASGKGYEVHVGTYMGRNGGRVSAINPDGLTIREYYKDYQGKRRERLQELKFHRNEGGE